MGLISWIRQRFFKKKSAVTTTASIGVGLPVLMADMYGDVLNAGK